MRSLFCFYDGMCRCFADPNGERYGVYRSLSGSTTITGRSELDPKAIIPSKSAKPYMARLRWKDAHGRV